MEWIFIYKAWVSNPLPAPLTTDLVQKTLATQLRKLGMPLVIFTLVAASQPTITFVAVCPNGWTSL
jgi:hypothetical protein